MKKSNNHFTLFLIIIAILLFNSCKKDIEFTSSSGNDDISQEINEFIYKGLKENYLWTDSVSYFDDSGSFLNGLLNMSLYSHSDHNQIFTDLLYKKRDKWSWIVDDYSVLENQLMGMAKSNGIEFELLRENNWDNKLVGYVRYVEKGSPASKLDIYRGDLFTMVNNVQLTIENYRSLLTTDSYELTFVKYSYGTFYSYKTVSVSSADFSSNPIFFEKIYYINSQRIGYLVLNGFKPSFDIQLNDVFKRFKDSRITDLILDLRYNPGGSIQTAIYLASMIYSTDTKKVFSKMEYNATIEAKVLAQDGQKAFNNYFCDKIVNTDQTSEVAINSLNLKRLYVICSHSTASASELIINCLKPYIPVFLVGETTVGKNVGSHTVYDYDENGIYNPVAHAKVNAKHKWAMQPIVMRLYNSLDQSDYTKGFKPDVLISELNELTHGLKPLGDKTEPLLRYTLEHIAGSFFKSAILHPTNNFYPVADSKDLMPHAKEMYNIVK